MVVGWLTIVGCRGVLCAPVLQPHPASYPFRPEDPELSDFQFIFGRRRGREFDQRRSWSPPPTRASRLILTISTIGGIDQQRRHIRQLLAALEVELQAMLDEIVRQSRVAKRLVAEGVPPIQAAPDAEPKPESEPELEPEPDPKDWS